MKTAFLFFAILWFGFSESFGAEIHVHQQGPLKTIQAALESAQAADTIIVHGGRYAGDILVTKPVVLIGIGDPILDGKNKTEILTIQANNVVVEGFILQHVDGSPLKENAAIRIIKSRNCIIRNNTLLDVFIGIYLDNASHCTVINNVIKGQADTETISGNAIHLWYSKYIDILNNKVSGHRDGIYLEFVENGTIAGNQSFDNLRYGLHFMFSDSNIYRDNEFIRNGAGVAVMYSKKIEMVRNSFQFNTGAAAYGILLKDINDSLIEENEFIGNTTGIMAEGCNRLSFVHNQIKNNGWAVKIMGSCQDLEFTENNFVGNSFELSVSSRNVSGHTLRKNFWSSYAGYDLNRDGYGDVPHRPVRLFSYLAEQVPVSVVLIRSLFIDLVELAEKITPSLTPTELMDETPAMHLCKW